jgi:hypothetical protein
LLVVVIGDGKLVVPVDFSIRRPSHDGPGAPCRDKLHWAQTMIRGNRTKVPLFGTPDDRWSP